MRVEQALFGDFRHIQIAQLCRLVLVEEDVRTFHVSVEDRQVVESLETPDDLDHDLPDVLFFHELFVVLALADALEDVAVVSKFHDDAVCGIKWSVKLFERLTRASLRVRQRMPVCRQQQMDF